MRDSTSHFVLATAGHVDHGKSALVQALTGTDPDRLPEEKARGLTIDLGFARLALAGADGQLEVGVIDVPGHEDFVKNMVAGVGAVDLALLVVAADDGWMQQSEEHLQVLEYLGVRHGIVALTKCDLLTTDKLAAAEAELREWLADSSFANAPVIPTSTRSGAGLDALRQGLTDLLTALPPPPDIGKPRLAVDRVFTRPGAGAVVTGTLTGGRFAAGTAVVAQPRLISARLRRLQTHSTEVESIGPGTRAALNLTDLVPDQPLQRGDVIALPGPGQSSETLDVLLTVSVRFLTFPVFTPPVLRHETRVHLHCGTARVAATVFLLTASELTSGNTAFAQLRLDRPLYVFTGDRFVIRDWGERLTVAGGIVLDPQASATRLRAARRLDYLESVAKDPRSATTLLLAALARDGAVQAAACLAATHVAAREYAGAMTALTGADKLVVIGPWCVDSALWQSLQLQLVDSIEQTHREQPQLPGLPLTTVRSSLPELFAEELFADLLAALARRGYEQHQTVLRRSGFEPGLPEALRATGSQLQEWLAQAGVEPPPRKDLLQLPGAATALQYLIDTGVAVVVSPELVMAADRYRQVIAEVRRYIEEEGPATVSDLRQTLGTTRRVMVPLAERLDRDGITVRSGDRRKLR